MDLQKVKSHLEEDIIENIEKNQCDKSELSYRKDEDGSPKKKVKKVQASVQPNK